MFKNIMAAFGILVLVIFALSIGIGMSYDADAPQRMSICSSGYVKAMNGVAQPEPDTITEECYSYVYDPKTGQRIIDESSRTKTEMSYEAYKARQDAKFNN